jgi:hypothetical protein
MHGSRSKIPSKIISSDSVAWRDLILVLEGLINHGQVKNANRHTDILQFFHMASRTALVSNKSN